jgi:signal transduction histidine kinase
MAGISRRYQIVNLMIPVVVLLLLTGYIIFTNLIFRSILENQHVVHKLQISYYRLADIRNSEPPDSKGFDYGTRVSRRGEEFVEGIVRLWNRPFFKEMRKFDPNLEVLMHTLLLASSSYTSTAAENMDRAELRETERLLEKRLGELYGYINEHGRQQMSTLGMANLFVTAVFILYTILLFSLHIRNRYIETMEMRVRAMGRAYIRRLEVMKKHIAYDIHDTVIQELGSSRLLLRQAVEESPHENSSVEDAIDSIEKSIDTLRAIINGIQQWDVRVYSLTQALRHLVDDLSHGMPFSMTLKTAGLQGIRLSEEHKAQSLAIVHEALINAKKHANASEVTVSAVAAGSRIEIRVRDDGQGFRTDTVSSSREGDHIGLVSMEERARIIGGTLAVRSKPKSGTVVRLSIPLETESDTEDALP